MPLDRDFGCTVAIEIETRCVIEPRDGPEHRLHALCHRSAAQANCPAADSPRTRQMVINLPPHDRCFADYRVRQVRGLGRGRVHHHGQRGLQRMGQIARMRPRLFGLLFGVGQQRVQFLHQRLHLQWQRFGQAVLAGRAQALNRQANPAQRAKPVPRLQGGHHEKAQAKHQKAPAEDRANPADLLIQFLTTGRHGEGPMGRTVRQDYRSLDHPQRLIRILEAVVDVGFLVEVATLQLKAAIPQRAGGKILMPLASHQPITAAVRFQKTLVPQRTVKEHLAIRPDLGRGDHGVHHILKLLIEITADQAGQRAIQRKTAQ